MKAKEKRAAEYYGLYKELGTLKAVGERVGLSHERVRQILSEFGYSSAPIKLTDEERKVRHRANGRRAHCKLVSTPEGRARYNARCREWMKNNPEKVKAAARRRYHKRMAVPGEREKHNKAINDLYWKDVEHSREVARAWVKANPEKYRATQERYRAKHCTRQGDA